MTLNAEKLKLLSRKQIQAVAIEHGIKGNMRSEDIIRILVKRYPNGVPLKLSNPRPAASQNSAASSRTVIMQWSESQGRYVEVPVGTSNHQPPPTAGPSQPQSQYRSLGVFTMPTTSYATAQRPTESSVTPSVPQPSASASSNSYRHYRNNNAPEFLPVPQLYSAPTSAYGRPDQDEAPRMGNSSSRPHAQQAPYPVAVPSTVWRAPASATGSTTRLASPARSRPPTPTDDSFQDQGPASMEPQPVHVVPEAQTSLSSGAQAPSRSPSPQAARGPEPQAVECDLASDSALYDAVRKMAGIARFQQHCLNNLESISAVASESGDAYSDIDALVEQECFHFRRMNTYLDHVHPELAPRWREEVIWDKACPTYVDDDDNLLEYDTDDEHAPKSPAPTMIKWHRKQPSREPSAEGEDTAGDVIKSGPVEVPAVTESASAPTSPKRKHVDENDLPDAQRTKKRTRRSKTAMPVPETSATSRLTRSAARRKVAEERTLDGVEEEEEQDMISVLSILSQPVDDDSD